MVLGLLLVLGLIAEAPAGTLLIPSGNPTGAASANGAMGGSVTLMPAMAIETGQPQVGPGSDDDLLVAAMTAQGFTVTNFTNLRGNDLTLGNYLAWADNQPAFTQGTITIPAQPAPRFAGANFSLGYAQNNANDPATTATHWISVVEDNNPTPFEIAHGIPDPIRPGFTLSVDNPGAPRDMMGNPTTPFYDAGGAANSTAFLDAPADSLNTNTRLIFHTFLATAGANGTSFNVFDDVTWGILIVPEPSSAVLMALGGGSLAFGTLRRWRRGAAPAA